MYAVISGCLILNPQTEGVFFSREDAQDLLYSIAEDRLYELVLMKPYIRNNYASLKALADDLEIVKIMEVF